MRQLHALSVLLGVAGTLLSVLAAGPLSRYFGEPVLARVLPVLGTTFVIDGFRTVPLALMSKELDYRRAASSDFVRAIASADLAVPVVLGTQWIEAVSPARALVCYAALQSVSVTIVNLLSSIGKTGITMRVSLLNLVVLPAVFVVGGMLGGITGIAWAWTCSYPFLLILPLRAMLPLLSIRLRDFLASFQRGAIVVGSMSAVVLGFRGLVAASIPAGLELLLAVLLGAAVAGITGWLLRGMKSPRLAR